MDYADSVHQVLIRKISKAEQDLLQLKLDYCRFIFGLSHRAQVSLEGRRYQVVSVDVDSMVRQDDGRFSKPTLVGELVTESRQGQESKVVSLGSDWELIKDTKTRKVPVES
ncbi:hypothetical protein [Marinobacter sp. BGYM27]|uniref:hypothetical protein n=1 Tax=unclassified Marinobacter TaxID=83889 RepID=UPI0021A71033|nr:hypothetical protein [Marinobacter sp. BGYM27]MDG5501658.1 hypothetical protein [Marinobacter sp. BGYM27]